MESNRGRFWRRFRALAQTHNAELYPHKPGADWDSYRHVGECPRRFAAYLYHIYKDHADVSLQVYSRARDFEECNRIFASFVADRARIEGAFGEPLIWGEQPSTYTSFIRYRLYSGGLSDEERWDTLQTKMLGAMLQLMTALEATVRAVSSTYE